MSERLEKTWADVLSAIHGHHTGLVGEGHVDPERLRLTVAARKEAVVQLRVKGLSLRQIAATLGVPKSTIHDDLSETGQKPSESGQALEVSESDILSAAKDIRAEKAKVSHRERTDKIADISRGNSSLGTTQRYPILYADPPWQYENPPMGGGNRSIENHYPTMTLSEICARRGVRIARTVAPHFKNPFAFSQSAMTF
jgi:predicted DNA-binding protein YlxM (UPF0122 family)